MLSCTFFGNPVPSITWKHNVEDTFVVNTVNYEKSEATSIINLNNLSWPDQGNVTCVAKSILGTAYMAGYVDVEGIIFAFLLH